VSHLLLSPSCPPHSSDRILPYLLQRAPSRSTSPSTRRRPQQMPPPNGPLRSAPSRASRTLPRARRATAAGGRAASESGPSSATGTSLRARLSAPSTTSRSAAGSSLSRSTRASSSRTRSSTSTSTRCSTTGSQSRLTDILRPSHRGSLTASTANVPSYPETAQLKPVFSTLRSRVASFQPLLMHWLDDETAICVFETGCCWVDRRGAVAKSGVRCTCASARAHFGRRRC
jgi:hypothetical protein